MPLVFQKFSTMQNVKIHTVKAQCSESKAKTTFATDVMFDKLSAITLVGNPTGVSFGMRVNNIEIFPDDYPAQELVGGAFRPTGERETSLKAFDISAKGSQVEIYLTGKSATYDVVLRYENQTPNKP
jgi:hypothetical protein